MVSLTSQGRERVARYIKSIYGVRSYYDLTDIQSAQVKEERALGHYPYIAYSHDGFIQVMSGIMRWFDLDHQPKTFMDVGCGLGDKLILARRFYDLRSYGVEYNKENAERARGYVSKRSYLQKDVTIYTGDAFDLSYEEYDLVYMYHPIADRMRQYALMEHVTRTMKDGAVFMEMLPAYIPYTYRGVMYPDREYMANESIYERNSPVVPHLHRLVYHHKQCYALIMRKVDGVFEQIDIDYRR